MFRRRPLVALQIEVTSRCNRRCAICPRTALAADWRDGDLNGVTWERLRRGLVLARHVHLQGWGEPLLHPHLAQMAGAAKAAGCAVGLTTNGDRLASAIDWVVATPVDRVIVSVAGDAATHADLRSGSRLDRIWEAVGQLVARRGRRRKPRVQISFLLAVPNIGQMESVVRAAAAAGADEMFVTHVDCTPSQELLDAAAFDGPGLRPGAREAIVEAARVARTHGIAFRAPAMSRQELLVCALDPLRFAFVGWDGRVGPCVNLLLPVHGLVPRCSSNGTTRVRPVVHGSLAQHDLGAILRGERRQFFTAPFAARLAGERRFLHGVLDRRGAEALAMLDRADRSRERVLATNAFPAACSGCHKAVGW